MKRFVICLAATFSIIFGGALWFHVMTLIFGPENAFVYAMMELAAISIAGIVWAFWNMISPEKEEKEERTVRIELIGRDLFKYEGDRIEKVGSMWEAKDWMEPLMKKTDWDQCMAAIEDRNKRETIQKLARQMDYRKAQKEKEKVREVELRSNFAADTYELIVKYEDGSVKIQPIDPMAIFEYGGVGKYLKDLERRLGLEFEIKTNF